MQRWAEQTSSVGFPANWRYNASIAYDKLRKRLVMFGGLYGSSALNETWELDYWGRWIQKFPATPPSARINACMIYDEIYQRVILFGGYNGSAGGTLNDDNIYEWDGTNWTTIAPGPLGVGGTLPGGRSGAGLAWGIQAPWLNHAYLFGGNAVGEVLQNSVYSLGHGGGFRYLWGGPYLPATRPSIRSNSVWLFIDSTKEYLLFGGYTGTPTNSETWVYNPGTNVWTQLAPVVSPAGRSHSLGFNVFPFNVGGTERNYLFGGYTAGYVRSGELWYFDRSIPNWIHNTSIIPKPSNRAASAGDWIPELRQMYLYGGDTGAGDNQTWGWAEEYIESGSMPFDLQHKTLDPFTAYQAAMGFYPEV